MLYVTERAAVILRRFIERTGDDSVELGRAVTADVRKLPGRESLGDPFLKPYFFPVILVIQSFPTERSPTCVAKPALPTIAVKSTFLDC